ncbi:MAG TPA: long-chain fatty acid--CoA ligase [Alphaproteobacteria bacterium]|nr:long-chain fatty acid--CoA ligase [Alphaproteobacteria bacterium]
MAKHSWENVYPDGVDWNLKIVPKPIPAILDEAAAVAGNRTMIDFLGRRFSFADLHDQANRAAKGLQALGIGPDTRVGLFMPNVPQYVPSLFGALKTGATAVNLSPLLAPRELAHMIEDSGTKVLITIDLKLLYDRVPALLADTCLEKVIVARMADALPFPKNKLYGIAKKKAIAVFPLDDQHMRFDDLLANDGEYAAQDIDPERTVALLQYTGGTTGLPKGAMLSHAAITSADAMYSAWGGQFRERPADQNKTSLVLPLFHIFGLSVVLLGAIRDRSEIILYPQPDIDLILKDIARKKPNVLPGVPTLFTALANHPKARETDFSSLNYCASGGAPLPPEVQALFHKVTGVQVYEGYGLTETSPAATAQVRKNEYRIGSCGVPLPGTEIEIRGLDDGAIKMSAGEIGEICIKGPQLMLGYWNREEETREALRDGWLFTGDTGYLDKDGYLFIVDRKKDLIISSGFNVYPRNVEDAIYEHDAVEEVTVIGIQDDYKGEVPKAFVKLRDGASLTVDDLKASLKDKLAKYEIPAEVEFRDALPKTPVGKLSKKELVAEEVAKRSAAKAETG